MGKLVGPFLWIGVMRAVLLSCGNLQVFMDTSKMGRNGNAKLRAHFLSKMFDMLSGPV